MIRPLKGVDDDMNLTLGFAATAALIAPACAKVGVGMDINNERVAHVDRRVEKPASDRCLKYESDPQLFGPCKKARVEASHYVEALETGSDVCVENTFGEPIQDCYARGVVVDPGSHSTIIAATTVDDARAKNFRKTENVYFDNDALIDLYLSEHGY